MTQTQKKTTAIFKLMERFLTQKEISAYDQDLLDEFGCDRKTLERYLNEIEANYVHIITIKRVARSTGSSYGFRIYLRSLSPILMI